MLPATNLLLHGNRSDGLPTFVLLHVFGLSRREWIETSIALAQQYRVISIDTPGFGEARDVPGYSVAEMADSFAETIAQLRLDRWILVGHSMTGKVAAVLASRGLPGLEKLALLTPSPLCPEPIAPEARAAMLRQAEPTREDAEGYVRENSALPIRPEIFERALEDRLRANPSAWRAWLEHGSEEDWSGRVPEVNLPTLVIAAEKDKSLGPAVQRKLTMPHFPRGRLETIAGSGHLVPLEAPERLAGCLHEFAGR